MIILQKMYNINIFTSLENITLLINNLAHSCDINTLPLKHISKLVNDLTRLFNDSVHCDVEIKIGVKDQDDVKIFKAHSDILRARSSYFEAALSSNWIKRTEDG